ncbi:MAG: hypothetical protein QOG67_1513 [Verrucomicrobiota bacterium]
MIIKREPRRALVGQHQSRLLLVPSMFRTENGGSHDVEKTMHLGFYFVAELPDRMVQASREFDRKLMLRRGDQCPGNLRSVRKSIRSHSAGAQLKTKRWLTHMVIVLGEQRDDPVGHLRRRFPKNRQIFDDRLCLSQQVGIRPGNDWHFQLFDQDEINIVSGKRANSRSRFC